MVNENAEIICILSTDQIGSCPNDLWITDLGAQAHVNTRYCCELTELLYRIHNVPRTQTKANRTRARYGY